MIEVRTLGVEEWELWRSLRRAALEESPDAFGWTLADWSGAGDTETRWQARFEAVPCNVVALLDGVPAGMVSGTSLSDGVVELISMWCTPHARGTGVGDALVMTIVDWAQRQGAESLELNVRTQNRHAITLYERHGFVDEGWSNAAPAEPAERRMRLRLARRGS